VAHALRSRAVMNAIPALTTVVPAVSAPPERPVGYHGAVCDFKRRLIETTLRQASGNRTHAARALGLQRTYLLRLIRELQVTAPPPPLRRRRAPA
jgi:DNA-binding NtrC family response regulator